MSVKVQVELVLDHGDLFLRAIRMGPFKCGI